MKKIIIYILFITLILNQNINVHASGGSFGDDAFISSSDGFYMVDDSSVPVGINWFYKYDDGKAWYTSNVNMLPLILNKGLGIVLSTDVLATFSNFYNPAFTAYYYINAIASLKKDNVLKNGDVVGRACNNISGCKLVNPSQNASDSEITVPSVDVNTTYEIYQDYLTDNNLMVPDYINMETRAPEFYKNKLDITVQKYQARYNYLNTENIAITTAQYDPNNLIYIPSGNNVWMGNAEDYLIVSNNDNDYEATCNAYNIDSTKNTVNFTDMMLNTLNYMGTQVKQIENGQLLDAKKSTVTFNNDGTYSINISNSSGMSIGNAYFLPVSNKPYITIYKNLTILGQVINETYAPFSFYSQKYYDYSENNDNSIITNTNEVNNSSTTNNQIYNKSSEEFTTYYSENNYQIDNSVTIENVTNITNNYYGDSGGGSGDDDDDDDGLLDRLLNGILDIFKWLAKIITAILTGIVELFATVLEAIAGLTTSFAGITDFFSTIFSWLPSEILTLMVLGLGLALLASFITWFK